MNLTDPVHDQEAFHHKIGDPIGPVMRQKLIEGRKNAVPVGVFYRAIARHCKECWPYQEDCLGYDCHLYDFRNPTVRRGKKKRETKRAIRLECQECLGGRRDDCQSPNCGLYHVRFGRNPEKEPR